MNIEHFLDRIFATPYSTAQTIGLIVFVLLVLVEVFISIRKNLRLYESRETAVNLSLGLLTSFSKILVKGLTLAYFTWLQEIWDLTRIPNTWWSILLLLLLSDLIAYWYHRVSHESRFFWALHVAHHSSGMLNSTTAVRGNFLHFWYRFLFWSPLAILGFDPIMIVLIDEIGFYYQMYIHTELIRKLPRWFEYFFNTPSHHRVHHAQNRNYLDKNYGAVFIIWDRIFGTFEPEVEKPVYGLTKNPPKKNNIPSIITHELGAIARDVKKTKGLRNLTKVVFGRPGSGEV